MSTLPLPSRRLFALPPLPRLTHWLPRLGWRPAPRPRQDATQAALEACASEGAEVDLRTVELDGQPYGALYRNGELVCLLPPSSPHSVRR